MKFQHQNFDLIIVSKNSNQKNKPLEFIFGDENIYKNELKRIWWNFKKENDSNFEISHDKIVNLNNWYNKENWENNIFFDYNEIEFQLNNDYKLSIESDYNVSWFLENITKKDDDLNKYKLWYKLKENDEKIYWFWWFVKFIIHKNNERFIFAPFFKTKNLNEDSDVNIMLNDIKEELFYSLFTNKNISQSSYKIRQQRDIKQLWWSFINIFELMYKDLEKSINDISENAKYINIQKSEVKKYNSWKITIDNRFINDCIKKGYYDKNNKSLNIYWKNIIQKKIIWEYNNTSNKIFIDLNQNLIKKLDTFLNIWDNKIKKEYLDNIKEKREKISSKRIWFINRYSLNITKLGNYSIDYQHLDSRYKKFVINYLKLFFMLDLLNWEIMLSNKSIDQVYEYWTLIKTRDILLELLDVKKDKNAIFNIKKNNANLVFELWDNSKVEIKWENCTCKIIYKFQNSISSITNKPENVKNDIRIISALVKPDIFVNIKNENIEKYYIMDAKYSTNEDWNIHKDRFENLYKYKAWIVKCEDLYFNENTNEWEWNMKTIIDEVIAIYPWENTEKLAKLYKKTINDIWFWWIVMKPWKEEELKDYFENRTIKK